MKKTSLGSKRAKILGVLALLAGVVAAYAVYQNKALPPLRLLDIQAGEPLGDALARSAMAQNIRIALDMQTLRFPLRRDGESPRYQVRIQGGEGKSALIKWTPISNTIWAYSGWVDEVDLGFANFHLTRADDPNWVLPEDTYDLPAGTLQSDMDAIVEIYESVQAMGPKPSRLPACYHNVIPRGMLAAQRKAALNGVCERVTMQTQKLSNSALRAVLREFYQKVLHEPNIVRGKTVAQVLNLGQWWLPNGSQLRMTATLDKAKPNDSEKASPLRFTLRVNVREYYRARIATSMAQCFDQQAIFPERVLYTLAQSSELLHKVMNYMYPPRVNGQALSDVIQIQEMDWAPQKGGGESLLAFVGGRRAFCEKVQQFQNETDYNGIRAPLSQRLEY